MVWSSLQAFENVMTDCFNEDQTIATAEPWGWMGSLEDAKAKCEETPARLPANMSPHPTSLKRGAWPAHWPRVFFPGRGHQALLGASWRQKLRQSRERARLFLWALHSARAYLPSGVQPCARLRLRR